MKKENWIKVLQAVKYIVSALLGFLANEVL